MIFCCSNTMKMKKVNTLIIIVMIFTSVQCSSSTRTRIYRTNMEGGRHIATSIEVARFKNEGVSGGTVEDSARKVPTGPDPLHHNNNPLDP